MEDKQDIEVVDEKLRRVNWEIIDGNKLKQLAKMRNRISEGTMAEIIEAIPEFANVAKESLDSIRSSYESSLKSNDKSTKKIYKMCEIKMNTLEKMLDEENLTFEQKKHVMDEMSEIINKMANADKENKKFMLDLFAGTSTALVAVVAILVSVINKKD